MKDQMIPILGGTLVIRGRIHDTENQTPLPAEDLSSHIFAVSGVRYGVTMSEADKFGLHGKIYDIIVTANPI